LRVEISWSKCRPLGTLSKEDFQRLEQTLVDIARTAADAQDSRLTATFSAEKGAYQLLMRINRREDTLVLERVKPPGSLRGSDAA
jgi:hypothetical protein